ncbi:MAG TPA: hypothetical protein VIL16_07640 [Trebonia sp.]
MTGLVVRGRAVDERGVGGRRRRRPAVGWSTPARIRAGAAAALVLACCLAAVIAVLLGRLDGEFQSIGNRQVPEVDAATGMYFSLNDMDAQVANVLLVGGNASLAADRASDLTIYGRDRATASRDLQQATVTEAGDATAQGDLQSVLDRIGQYETLAADALLTSQQGGGTAGRAPAASVGYYQQATDLMQTGILPTVSSLTNVSASEVNSTYQAGLTTSQTGIVVVIALGVLLVAAAVALQLYLTARCRRMVHPALAVATLVAIALVGVTVAQLSAEAGHLRVAKQDAFDSIIALTQARAVSYDANADESRYLVDPGRAAQYQQAFGVKSDQIASVGPVGIFGYDAALATDIRTYQSDSSDVRFGGYLGAEFRNITFPGERAAAVRTLLAYQVYERDDRVLRTLAKSNLPAAVAFDIGPAASQSDGAFNRYDAALSSVIAINSRAFTAAVQDGQGGAGWDIGFPAAAAVILALLLLAGVRPRLAEYR